MLKKAAFDYIETHKEEMVSLWRELVSIESPSNDKVGVDTVAARIKAVLMAEGAVTELVEFEKAGNLLVATYGEAKDKAPVALIGHMDTVFPRGTIEQRPFTIQGGKAYGPGVLDMKGGIVVLLYVLKALKAAGYIARPLKVILAGDEEVGHQHSEATQVFRQEAAGCIAAFNFETGFVDNRIVVGRKGGYTFAMEVHGVAAHTGNNPKAGRSAVLELAHKTIDIHKLTDWETGTTFSVGTFHGGTVVNSAPDFAKAEIDVRCVSEAAARKVERQLREIAEKTYIEGTRTVLTGGVGFMPMETTDGVMKLFELLAATSEENNFGKLTPAQSGGASDSSNTVIAGVPTVCALGVKGEHNHSPLEYALVDSLFERAKLVAACILNLDQGAAQ